MSASPIRVMLVDDDPLVRSGLRMLLGGTEAIEVVAEADDGDKVLGAVDRHRPDVVLMDIRMPGLDGVSAAGLLAAQPSPPAILMLTTFDADDLVLRALRAGAAGFLLKDTPPAEIVRAIELVHAGDSMLSPAVTRRLIDLVAGEVDESTPRADADQLARRLSPRELEVARCVGRGLSNADISAELHLSVATVKAHVSRLLEKLDADNRVQIALLIRDASPARQSSLRSFLMAPDARRERTATVARSSVPARSRCSSRPGSGGGRRRSSGCSRTGRSRSPSCGCGRRCRSSSWWRSWRRRRCGR